MTTRTLSIHARSRAGEDDISLALNPAALREEPPETDSPHAQPVTRVAARRDPIVVGPGRPGERGVELAYPRMAPGDAISCCPISSPNGTATHILPAMTAALAIDDGEIIFAGRLGQGFGMIIDHGNGCASHYANLQAINRFRACLLQKQLSKKRINNILAVLSKALRYADDVALIAGARTSNHAARCGSSVAAETRKPTRLV